MMSEIATLDMLDQQKAVIDEFMEQYPISQEDVDSYHAMFDTKRDKNAKDALLFLRSQRLIPPAATLSTEMEEFRTSLPTFGYRSAILSAIEHSDVTLITGGTGCGKSTQVPQFILEYAYWNELPVRVFCTQPRRFSTIAISKRVASERGEAIGATVGYHIRFEQKVSSDTILTYCTSGVLLRMLTAGDFAKGITHIVLDEVHEREQNTDYLLIALKQALRKRDDLKVILMSATMGGNLNVFKNYFDTKAAHVDVPSKLYRVEKFGLADVLAMTSFFTKHSDSGCDQESFQKIFHRSVVVGEFPPNIREKSCSTRSGSDCGARDLSPDLFGETNSGMFGRFGFHEGYRNNMEVAIKHLSRTLPNRPKFFDPCFTATLRRSALRRDSLVDLYLQSYMNIGGYKFSEVVDIELICTLVCYLMDSPVKGAILIFLPGYEDIMQAHDRLIQMSVEFQTLPMVYMLHSQINSYEQQAVFSIVPHTHRKVILSTNIAEASLTIDDVVFVIDCGKVKEKTYDYSTRISQLRVQWIAKSNAEQRTGRAGRCRDGFCFRLYSDEDYKHMLDTQIPEMRRAAIYDVCLHAKIFAPRNMSVRKFLEMAPEPPSTEAVKQSLEFLEQLGALYTSKTPSNPSTYSSKFLAARSQSLFREPELTDLGRVLAFLPLDPQLSRLLLFGLFLRCLDPIVTLVSVLSHRDPFVLPMDDESRDNALNIRAGFARNDLSDHLMLIRAYNAYAECVNSGQTKFCNEKFLSSQTMKHINGIRKQLLAELKRMHFLPHGAYSHHHPKVNMFRNSWPMIQAAIVAGCYPGVGVVKDSAKLRKVHINSGQNAYLHPSSVLKRQTMKRNKKSELGRKCCDENMDPIIDFLVYQELSRASERIMLRTVTVVPPLAVFIFTGSLRIAENDVRLFDIVYDSEHPSKSNIKKTVKTPEPIVFLSPWSEACSSKATKANSPTATLADLLSGNNESRRKMADKLSIEKKRTEVLDEEQDKQAKSTASSTSDSSTCFESMVFEVPVDSWLSFNAHFGTMQSAIRLRFKFMSYFCAMLKNPSREVTQEDEEMLNSLEHVLELDHKRNFFTNCGDLSSKECKKSGSKKDSKNSD